MVSIGAIFPCTSLEQTMTRMNIVLGAAALLCAAGCFVLFTEVNDQRDRVRALEAQVDQLQRELSAAATASPPVATNTAAQTTEPPAQPAPPPQPSQSNKPAVTKPAADANREWRRLLADPAYRQARLATVRLDLQRGYPQLVAALGLSSDEAERFLDLLAEQSLRESEQGMKERGGQDYAQWSRELYAQFDKERRAFLGEERFRTWTEYVQSTQARGMVSDLRTQLATTNSPLREDQVKPFVKALAAEHQRHAAERQENYQGETGAAGGWTEATPASQQIEYMERRDALIQASLDRQQEVGETYLDSVQQREFNAMLDRQRERARLELESFRAQAVATERNRSSSR
jgi:hypothetical protein